MQHNAVGRDLLLVIKDDNVADLDVFQTGLNDVLGAFLQRTNFLDRCRVDFFIILVTCVVSNTLFEHSDKDDDAEDDSDNEW